MALSPSISPSFSDLALCVVISLVINLSALFLLSWHDPPKAGVGELPSEAVSLNFEKTAIIDALQETEEGNSASTKGGVTEQAAVEERKEVHKEEGEKTEEIEPETKQDTKPEMKAEPPEVEKQSDDKADLKDPKELLEQNTEKKSENAIAHVLPEPVPQSEPEQPKTVQAPQRKQRLKEDRKSRKAKREEQKRQLAQAASERGLNASGETTSDKEGGRISGARGNSRYYTELNLKIRKQIRRFSDNTVRGSGVIEFTLDHKGRLVSIHVLQSSGSETLDRAAMSAIRNAAPFPKPPLSLEGLNFKFPYTYQ